MTKQLTYTEALTFYKVNSGPYRGKKVIIDEADVMCIFVQNTGTSNSNNQEQVDADAICYPDFENAFIIENANRLEGMYILADIYGAGDESSWYKVESVTVNRDHLLGNQIDNVELALKKTTALSFVS